MTLMSVTWPNWFYHVKSPTLVFELLNDWILELCALCENECVRVCVRGERERMCAREREWMNGVRVCMCVWKRVNVCEREREWMCVRESVRERRVNVWCAQKNSSINSTHSIMHTTAVLLSTFTVLGSRTLMISPKTHTSRAFCPHIWPKIRRQ